MIRNSTSFALLVLCCAGVLIAAAGCGSRQPQTFPVSGQVSYKGKSVERGTVTFNPIKGRPASGNIGPDGRYSLTTFKDGDGALPGRCRVTIDARRTIEKNPANQPKSLEDEARMGAALAKAKVEWLVPQQYARPDTTPLVDIEVKSGPNTIDLRIP
jgi:hypothetical protein